MIGGFVIAGVMISGVSAFASEQTRTGRDDSATTSTAISVESSPRVASAEPQAAATPAQVSAIVGAEFSAYDRDGDGTLNKAEFTAWMDALKTRAPDRPEKPGGAAWNEAAFAKADADKSTTVTAIELAGFLSGSVKSGD